MRQEVEVIAGVSGVFLFVAYITGRLYLEAYFGVFGADLRDLGYSIEDVMFQSWRTLLPAFFSALLFAAVSPWFRSLQSQLDAASEDVSSLGDLLDEITGRRDALEERFSELKKVVEEQGEVPETHEEAMEIHKDFHDLNAETEAYKRLSSTVDEDHAILKSSWLDSKLGRLLGNLADRIENILPVQSYLLVGLLLGIGFVVIVEVLEGDTWRTTTLDLGVSLSFALISVIVAFFGLRAFKDSSPFSHFEYLGLAGLVLAIVVALPLATGTLDAHADRNSNDPGRDLRQVTLASNEKILDNWLACGDSFESPPLRLLGRSSGLVILWDPDAPESILQVPIEKLLHVRSTETSSIGC